MHLRGGQAAVTDQGFAGDVVYLFLTDEVGAKQVQGRSKKHKDNGPIGGLVCQQPLSW